MGEWCGCKFAFPGSNFYLKFEYRSGSVGSGRNSDLRGLVRGTGSCS